MSLETFISGAEDRLLDSLHFGGRNSASYIVSRRDATFAPSSSGSWAPGGIRLCRFNLADAGGVWLDGKTVRLVFTLTNTHATDALTPICDTPLSLWRRFRLIASGSQTLEDLDDLSRTAELFSNLLPGDLRMTNIGETWCRQPSTTWPRQQRFPLGSPARCA